VVERALTWRMVAAFEVPGIPVPKARPRARIVGRHARIYTPAATKRFESLVASCVPADAERPGELVRVDLVFFLPRPKHRPRYMPRWLWSLAEPYHRAVGDVDNYSKAVLDGLDGWLGNDIAVVDLRAQKRVSVRPRVEVRVYSLVEPGSEQNGH